MRDLAGSGLNTCKQLIENKLRAKFGPELGVCLSVNAMGLIVRAG